MPLITITCSSYWYPTDDYRLEGTKWQQITDAFGCALPDIIAKDGDKLGLDPDTPPGAVQVNYELFHPRAVNVPDIWIKVELTEVVEDEATRKLIRDELKRRIESWFTSREELILPSDLALDIFWGPGHGYVIGFSNGAAFDW